MNVPEEFAEVPPVLGIHVAVARWRGLVSADRIAVQAAINMRLVSELYADLARWRASSPEAVHLRRARSS